MEHDPSIELLIQPENILMKKEKTMGSVFIGTEDAVAMENIVGFLIKNPQLVDSKKTAIEKKLANFSMRNTLITSGRLFWVRDREGRTSFNPNKNQTQSEKGEGGIYKMF